ncbi:MAG: divergent polysaccharide deacetylase family protein [Arcobacter sp.]|uniref:divergent polysaccharide deacetylase family protein n=1 Tax=Arcobacter sp. TaxID=1872629 RepID=UPI003D02BE8C
MNQKKNKSKKRRIKATLRSKKKLIQVFLLILLFTSLISISSYFLFNSDKSEPIEKTPVLTQKDEVQKENKTFDEVKLFDEKKPEQTFDEIIPKYDTYDKFEEYTQALEKDFLEKTLEDEQQINEKIVKKIEEIKEDKKKIKEEKAKEEKEEIEKQPSKIDEKSIITKKDTFVYDKKNKPKLAIIIDDVSTSAEKEKILNIGYPITMAFLPPTSSHKDSAKIAQNLSFYMIHFPMQASSAFKSPEVDTLKITDSYEKIENRVKQLRAWYPNAIYTNNHTGSVFTENEEAMDKLFKALKKYNFIFVDSRTSSKSVAKQFANKYNMPYIVRNTFIDNDRNFSAIQNQLKKAVEIAKKQGYAIAIGHPHDITLKVLKESKHLLKDVEPIFVNKLPYL